MIRKIREFISIKHGKYGIYVIDIQTGKAFGINDKEAFVAASTTKVPINLYLYSLIAKKKMYPEEMLVYTEEDYEEGTGSIQYQEFGSRYSIRELTRLSIEISDNVATNMLVRRLGFENVKVFMEQTVKHPVDFENNLSTPRDMSIYLKGVLDFAKKSKDLGNELLGYFENTEFKDRIPLHLPADTVVAHKIGNQVGALHDVGIVFTKSPFIISIMTKEVYEDEAYEAIVNIARMVYDFETDYR